MKLFGRKKVKLQKEEHIYLFYIQWTTYFLLCALPDIYFVLLQGIA
jgi:hypothetical protein